jgi:DNA-binding transcriptional MerR regulator
MVSVGYVFSVYRIGEFAKRVGRAAGTVRRWEREGRIQARRGPTGQRYFDESDIRKVRQPGFAERSRTTVV